MKVGEKYFKLKDNKLIIVRIKKLGEQVTVLLGNDKYKIGKDVLEKEYTLLKPHGSIFFNIVNLHNTSNDIIVTLFREEDKKTDQIPYAVCRQNITDFFTKNIINIQRSKGILVDDIDYIGLSLSKDTCLDDIPYEVMVACDGVQYSEEISIYLDDTLDDILSLVNKASRYNRVLEQLHEDSKKLGLLGACNNIRLLLEDNKFIDDFMRGFKIINFEDIELIINDDYSLDINQQDFIQAYLNTEIMNTYVYEYDGFSIDIKQIKRDHIIIRDGKNKIYIVAYDKGDYIEKDIRKVINISKHVKNDINNTLSK